MFPSTGIVKVGVVVVVAEVLDFAGEEVVDFDFVMVVKSSNSLPVNVRKLCFPLQSLN